MNAKDGCWATSTRNRKILTCFLEYFPHRVMVHDILYEKEGGKWIQKVGSYPKLRLDAALLTDLLQKNGIQLLKSEIINRMIYLTGKKAGQGSVEEIIH